MVRLLATGGGGVTHGMDASLEDALASLLPAGARAGYIGHANGDDPVRLRRVLDRFAGLGMSADHLPVDTAPRAAAAWLAGLDMLYLGGGNTGRTLARWRAAGLDTVLADAARRGLLLAGVSAGAVCWFERVLWDGAGEGFRVIPGLGLLPGSCCAHFSTEPDRSAAYRAHVAAGLLPGGVAIDDGAAVLFDDGVPVGAVAARPDAGARRITRSEDGALAEAPVPPLSTL